MTSPYFYAIVLIVVLWVLILPMRNGNNINPPAMFHSFAIHWFLSYLWGMETYYIHWCNISLLLGSYPTYEEWKLFNICINLLNLIIVLILPMRNGNFTASYASLKYSSKVLILPMRNGNFSSSCISLYAMGSFLSYLWGMETLTFPKYLSVL